MTTDTALVILWLMTNVTWALAWRVQCADRDSKAADAARLRRDLDRAWALVRQLERQARDRAIGR